MNAPDSRRNLGDPRVPVDGLSHVVGATDHALSDRTIGAWLDHTASRHGDLTACVFPAEGLRLTWAQLRDRADRLAGGLVALGFQPGDRLGIWAPNRSEWILVQYATARIGVILVNINPAYRIAELEYALKKVGCRGLVLAPSFKGSDYVAMLTSLAPELTECEPGRLAARRLPALECVIRLGRGRSSGMFAFDDVMVRGDGEALARARHVGRNLDSRTAINIQFTSGTTGAPKGATLTHRNIVNNAIHVAEAMRFGVGDRLCIPVPLYHCFGMVMGSLVCATTGGTMVFPAESFDAAATLDAILAEQCTHLHGVPTMFVALLEALATRGDRPRALRGGIMAGAPCPIELMKRVQSGMGLREITIAYGMTETSPVSFQTAVDDPVERRVSTVGRVMPHLEVRIVGADGATVPVGTPGELATRGYSVMQGYWGDPGRTAEVVRDGWMHTGDLAVIDAEGYCNIVGRLKDMIIRGGENVYPREVEEFLYTHPDVAQVQVFGVPDARLGEEVCAWIVPRSGSTPTEDAIRAHCRERIAHYKIPRHIRFVSELPMTVTGKPQKFVMRERMAAELGRREAATA
jgi:fatty-acyl-CoA synthase